MTKVHARPNSFTLVELLTVIAIIAILAGLMLYAGSGVMREAARSRAHSEIAGLSASMESYKSDNGIYPTPANGTVIFANTNAYNTASVSTPGGTYQESSELLYQNLSGMDPTGTTPVSGGKTYFPFKKTQLALDTSGNLYIKDPFGNSYGYFNGNGTSLPYNGTNSFDLWSTAGDTAGTNQPGWVSNFGS
jgi:prepilin-type N-terminal cleavage/methylation domain-containing protein